MSVFPFNPDHAGGTTTVTKPDEDIRSKILPPYNVILLDDNDHSYEYVIGMLKMLFAMPIPKGIMHAREVDATGRTILLTTSKEHAELKQEQVHAYGRDPAIPHCAGSMTAVIEPAH